MACDTDHGKQCTDEDFESCIKEENIRKGTFHIQREEII